MLGTDMENNIDCTDKDTNKIVKSSKDGGNVLVKKVKQMNGPRHYGVEIK